MGITIILLFYYCTYYAIITLKGRFNFLIDNNEENKVDIIFKIDKY